jgi:hypothetical protein
MKTRAKYIASLASLTLLLFAGLPAHAAFWDVAFYELTEDMSVGPFLNPDGTPLIENGQTVTARIGSGSLAGAAKIGKSPLCPQVLMDALVAAGFAKRNKPCYVSANGRDQIRLDYLTGTFDADIRVKVQGDNPVDAPELTVLVAKIHGSLQIPYPEMRKIVITSGVLTITHRLDPATFSYQETSTAYALTGMVRLPFVREDDGRHRRARRNDQAFYLSDRGRLIPLKRDEISLGVATARFELNFDGSDPINKETDEEEE